MKTFYSAETQTEILFARNQRNLMLGNLSATFNPAREHYELIDPAGFRVAVVSGIDIAGKIKAVCVKNNYRCAGVQKFEQFKPGAL